MGEIMTQNAQELIKRVLEAEATRLETLGDMYFHTHLRSLPTETTEAAKEEARRLRAIIDQADWSFLDQF